MRDRRKHRHLLHVLLHGCIAALEGGPEELVHLVRLRLEEYDRRQVQLHFAHVLHATRRLDHDAEERVTVPGEERVLEAVLQPNHVAALQQQPRHGNQLLLGVYNDGAPHHVQELAEVAPVVVARLFAAPRLAFQGPDHQPRVHGAFLGVLHERLALEQHHCVWIKVCGLCELAHRLVEDWLRRRCCFLHFLEG